MKNLLIKSAAVLTGILLLLACGSDNTARRLDGFVSDTEKNCDSYNSNDWNNSIKEYEELLDDFDSEKESYSEDDIKLATEAIGRYHALLIQSGIKLGGEYFNLLKQIAPAYLNGFSDGLEENVDALVGSIKDAFDEEELEKTMDDAVSGLENVFSNLADAIEESFSE